MAEYAARLKAYKNKGACGLVEKEHTGRKLERALGELCDAPQGDESLMLVVRLCRLREVGLGGALPAPQGFITPTEGAEAAGVVAIFSGGLRVDLGRPREVSTELFVGCAEAEEDARSLTKTRSRHYNKSAYHKRARKHFFLQFTQFIAQCHVCFQ